MSENPDEALSMLADMARATDRGLRELARRLAGRLMVDVARHGPVRQRGVGRMATTRFDPDAGDLDVDASIDAIVEAQASAAAIDPDGLRVRRWVRPRTAICLLVDRSGSMSGKPLATNAVAAAAVAQRSEDFSVISFAKDGLSIKSQDVTMEVELVVDRILGLRGRGSTNVAGALELAAQQLMRSTAGRKVTILLSDCRATEHGDVVGAARRLDELVILAPRGDDEAARELARETGSRVASITGPTDVPAAIADLLG